jgi:RNA polymerase sigma-70 factor, ECF subfamily
LSDTTNDYDRLIAPIRRRMVNSIWRIVRDPDQTEDVVQEVMLRLVTRIERIRAHPNPTAMVLRMCVNGALDHVRRRRRRGAARPYPAEELPDRRNVAPPELLARDERRAEVLAAIAELPRRQAEALVLLAIEDVPYPEIAQTMGCRESTVRVLVSKARRRLRARLEMPSTLSNEKG